MKKRAPRRRARSLRLETLEGRQLLAADLTAFEQNPFDPADVNNDGAISARDLIPIIQAMRGQDVDSQMMLDTNGDGRVSIRDMLRVMNDFRRRRDQPVAEDRIRSLDGSGNNLEVPELGAAGTELIRLTSTEYADGVSEPAGEDRPSAREISNEIAAQTESIENDRGLTDMLWLWGQFIDHDIDLTEGGEEEEYYPISVPTGDAYFDPTGMGEVSIPLTRSEYDDSSGVREQINSISSFLDGSMIYGVDEERLNAIREFDGGRLLVQEGDLLPWNEAGLGNAGGTSDSLFLAGDVRANENAALTAMHTLWVREHNRIADQISEASPRLSDEQVFQRARMTVIAEIQAITYNEFLPALLGDGAISDYDGYDSSVDPSIANIFSTGIYRFGHSMLSSDLQRLNADGTPSEEGSLALQEAFFNPSAVVDNGIDSLLMGAAVSVAQEIDNQVVDDVRNFLFGPPGSGGFDLAALNIQRGRDHGLPDYNQARVDMGLEAVESFSDITSNEELAAKLEALYGDVDSIDVWVGALAEDHVDGASVGELAMTVMVDQFERIRDGDRLWYENVFSGRELRRINSTSLADVIARNTDLDQLPENVFQVGAVGDGSGGSDRGRDGRDRGGDDRGDNGRGDNGPADPVAGLAFNDLNLPGVGPTTQGDGGRESAENERSRRTPEPPLGGPFGAPNDLVFGGEEGLTGRDRAVDELGELLGQERQERTPLDSDLV